MKPSDPSFVTRRDILYRLGALGAGAVMPRLLTGPPQPVPSGPLTAATVTITNTVTGVIGPAFAGLSYEKSQMANPFFSPQNADAIGLFKLIGPSLLRIGGNSVDKTTWTPNGHGRTSGQVAPSDIDALAGFLKATGWQVLYGTNLATSTPALAAGERLFAQATVLVHFEHVHGNVLGENTQELADRRLPGFARLVSEACDQVQADVAKSRALAAFCRGG